MKECGISCCKDGSSASCSRNQNFLSAQPAFAARGKHSLQQRAGEHGRRHGTGTAAARCSKQLAREGGATWGGYAGKENMIVGVENMAVEAGNMVVVGK